MEYQTLRLRFDGPVAHLVLTGPDRANVIDARFLLELADATSTIADRADVIVTLLEAEGADFCRGWDKATRDEIAATRSDSLATFVDPFAPIATLACPTIAALQGEVRSAGLELALACDIRIGADDSRFALPEVSEGRLPLAGGSQRLPRLVGRALALAMLLTGEELDAEAAYRAGLVSRVVPRAELSATAHALARRLSERGPVALRYAKEAVHRGLEMSLDQGLRYETDLSIILQTTADRAEGVRAFFEKRLPHFEGR